MKFAYLAAPVFTIIVGFNYLYVRYLHQQSFQLPSLEHVIITLVYHRAFFVVDLAPFVVDLFEVSFVFKV